MCIRDRLKGYEVIKDWVKAADVQEPDPKTSEIYDKYYKIYLKLYEKNKELYKELYALV